MKYLLVLLIALCLASCSNGYPDERDSVRDSTITAHDTASVKDTTTVQP